MRHLAESINSKTKIAVERNCVANDALNEVMCSFDRLCLRLIDNVSEEQFVASERVGKFSEFTTFFLRNRIVPNSKSYGQLTKLILEYWHYDLSEDNNHRRACSYVQIYQMISMLQQNRDERKSEYVAHVEVKKQQHDTTIINAIKETPGITFKDLQSISSLSSENLRDQLEKLEAQNFVISRRTGDYQYYSFTYLGELLYQDLCSGTHNIWADQWNPNRIRLLVLLIIKSYKADKPVLLCDLVNYVSYLDEATLYDICQNALPVYSNDDKYFSLLSLMIRFWKYNDYDSIDSLMERFWGNNKLESSFIQEDERMVI